MSRGGGVTSNARQRLLRYLRRGGVVFREDCGGAVGVVWMAAPRCSRVFETPAGDRLLEAGCVIKRVPYRLVQLPSFEVPHYALREVANDSA